MRICAVQARPVAGSVQTNIAHHRVFIDLAASSRADLVVFPELSLTGYEPLLAKGLAANAQDDRFNIFQELSDAHQMTICAGMPIKGSTGIMIGMIIFQPEQPRQTYCKQFLHSDELPYFVAGNRQALLMVKHRKVAPAICYESLLLPHAQGAFALGADVYAASVAKPVHGVEKGFRHYPEIARRFSATVLMSNSIGPADGFLSVGKSSVWNQQGDLVGQLDDANEGILIFDTETQESLQKRV